MTAWKWGAFNDETQEKWSLESKNWVAWVYCRQNHAFFFASWTRCHSSPQHGGGLRWKGPETPPAANLLSFREWHTQQLESQNSHQRGRVFIGWTKVDGHGLLTYLRSFTFSSICSTCSTLLSLKIKLIVWGLSSNSQRIFPCPLNQM